MLTLMILAGLSCLSSSQKVYTKYGVYEGFREDTDGRQVSKFYGIPYARPPVADLRFRPPRSLAENANDTVEAKIMKPACPQNPAIFSRVYANRLQTRNTSEDCLYLNIYVPGSVDRTRTQPLAVMVWIHGGGFQYGTGSAQDGSRLALAGDVIVVTFNYRLGILGFLGTGDMVVRGNNGLLDQIKALQWIQSNIEPFGGDPNKVTIFGESSGSYSVGLLMLSPLSKGLFARAISQSGTAIMNGLNKRPLERTIKVAQKLNCSIDYQNTLSVVSLVRCLRTVPVNNLVEADVSIDKITQLFTPTVDGQFLLREPEDIIRLGKFTAVDYIVGLNSDEGSATLESNPSIMNGPGINRTTFETLLLQTFLSVFPATIPPGEADVVWSTLLAQYLPTDDSDSAYRRRYLDVTRDVFAAQTLKYATIHSQKANCYVYYFNHRPSDSKFPSYIDAAHRDEKQFVFGDITSRGTKKEIQLSVDMMMAWTSFANNGTPIFHNDQLEWRKYTPMSEEFIDLTVNMTKENMKTRLLERGNLLWNDVLPGIVSLSGRSSMAALKQVYNKDWGMPEDQMEEVFLSLILVATFLVVVCAALVRMLCYVNKAPRRKRKSRDFTNRGFVSDGPDTTRSIPLLSVHRSDPTPSGHCELRL